MAAARKVGKGMIEKALVGAVAVAVVKGLKGGPRRPDNAGPDNDGDRGRVATTIGDIPKPR